jgi:exonuclease V
MRQGSKVHKVLEEQVHDIVPVRTESKEDRFGLKIWNTIQGLRTLRATGLTRELEVWGVVEGQLVNGVIDELSYTCPDGHLAQSLKESVAGECAEAPPKGQRNIAQMLTSAGSNASAGTERVVYLADVKTRGVKSVPAGASLRPTWMQLMLYRKLLEALAQNNVDADTIFARYDLQPLEPFTDTFVTEIGGVDGMTDPSGDENPFSALQDSEIESHRNLSALWSLMISEFSETMTTISDVLRAEFRWSRTGELIGSELFAYDTKVIESYIESEMSWWKGERDAVGVEVEEAFKCRACDFAEECSWRKTKVEEATEKHRLRVAERKKSAV